MERNELYPVFLKVPQLNILIEGGDNLAEEKLTFLLKSRPRANLEMVSPKYWEATIALAKKFGIQMYLAAYDSNYLLWNHMVIATADIISVNERANQVCRTRNILVNVADNPHIEIFIWEES